MDCLIKVIKGPDSGREHRLPAGDTVIGRGGRAHVKLSPESISWEHAVISRVGEDYFLENLSAHGTFVNDAKVGNRTRLKVRDQIRVGADTVLRMEAVAGQGTTFLQNPRVLWAVLAVAAVLLIVLVAFDPFGGPAGDIGNLTAPEKVASLASNPVWARGHDRLAEFLEEQVQNRALPELPLALFENAWRLDLNRDTKGAQTAYKRLQIAMDTQETNWKLIEKVGDYPRALERLLLRTSKDPALSDDELRAAFVAFIRERLQINSKQGTQQRLSL